MFTLNSIFPTAFITSNIGRNLTEEERNVCEKHSSVLHKNVGNNYISDNRYVLDKDLPDIKKFITHGINAYVFSTIKPKENLEFYITQSWINYTNRGESHHRHSHPNSIISGVFYINADKNVDKIQFHNEKYNQIKIESSDNNVYNSDLWIMPVGTGDLIIFPSSLYHSVPIVDYDNNTRISLAFNVFVKGNLGTDTSLNFLHLE